MTNRDPTERFDKNVKNLPLAVKDFIDEKAYDREFGAFKGIDELSQRIIITNDDPDYSTSVVRHIKLKDFLLMKEK